MTPGARVAAAIEILDIIGGGQPAQQALTRWARNNRFAGSKDRAAIRDHVFDVLRHWRSDAVRGGNETGRARMIGRLRGLGIEPATLFHGEGHAPAPLTDAEQLIGNPTEDKGAAWDLPDWLVPVFEESLSDDAERTALALTERAPVTLRVNLAKTTMEQAQARLTDEGIATTPNQRAASALTVTEGARRIRNSASYLEGMVEIQDASSQGAVLELGTPRRALDICAGGGGKALAMAALGWSVTASDIDEKRMTDLPGRAARGGHDIAICPADALVDLPKFDLVFVDAPCSGAGTWRRTPDAKWALTRERLDELGAAQRKVLSTAASLVAPGGALMYATCSVLKSENEHQIQWFMSFSSSFEVQSQTFWPVDESGDGFFVAHLTREN